MITLTGKKISEGIAIEDFPFISVIQKKSAGSMSKM